MNEQNYLNEMILIPGRGPSEKLLRHLSSQFTKPREPLGEPWFLSETRYLHKSLNSGGVEAVSNPELTSAFEDVVSGLGCFPEMAYWSEWYGYLVTRILNSGRHHEEDGGYLTTYMHDGLFLLAILNSEHPAHKFQAEFAALLAALIMEPHFWQGNRYLPFWTDAEPRYWHADWWKETQVSRSFLLAWRYLRPEAIQGWVRSVRSIPDAHWRAYFIVWLVQLKPVFDAGLANLSVLKSCNGGWKEFTELFGLLKHRSQFEDVVIVSENNVAHLHAAVRAEFTTKRYFDCLDQFAEYPQIWPAMEIWLEQFQQLFLE